MGTWTSKIEIWNTTLSLVSGDYFYLVSRDRDVTNVTLHPDKVSSITFVCVCSPSVSQPDCVSKYAWITMNHPLTFTRVQNIDCIWSQNSAGLICMGENMAYGYKSTQHCKTIQREKDKLTILYKTYLSVITWPYHSNVRLLLWP